MRTLLIVALGPWLLASCTTPMQRAHNICDQLGTSSPSCFERQFNIERARADTHYRRQGEMIKSALSVLQTPRHAESEYDRRVTEFEGQAKARCGSGQVFTQYGSGWVCETPQVPQQEAPRVPRGVPPPPPQAPAGGTLYNDEP
jgi:hypothetical protein